MEYINGLSDIRLPKASAVTLGKFDGLHIGHRKLIDIVKEKASELDLLSVLFTFDSIPLSLLPQKNQHFLTTNSERKAICEKIGLDCLVEYPFTEEFMNMEALEFVKKIVVDNLRAKVVVVGTDYGFGKNRSGDVNLLKELGDKYGFETIIVEKEKYQDQVVSSTYIRHELQLGHMETVNVLLNRPFSITGIVSSGKQLGRTIDMPTVNIYPTESKLLPPKGVYASKVIIDNKEYYGVTNLGTKPTVNASKEVSVETNIFNFNENIYGKKIEVMLMHFLRTEIKFDSVESLKKQMESDKEFAKNMFLIS
ncbi:bifunctional riboflavin kinase/FAD synthetase [Lachnospira multipara]|uniref:bifunctional riboflavin kinase/FAD synthetase n=1 Tax=Lachnospira multipara TaxID=28051 RepID=UPI00048899DE|nr:bifunctional riboflavin kinase/FAD synthetase [Lachnospira multipara]